LGSPASAAEELGASPTLTVQIQGESLLNDGTAIVLYTVAYDMLKGEHYDMGGIVVFVVKTAGTSSNETQYRG